MSEHVPEWVRIMTTEFREYMQKEAGYYLTYMDAVLEQGWYIYMLNVKYMYSLYSSYVAIYARQV